MIPARMGSERVRQAAEVAAHPQLGELVLPLGELGLRGEALHLRVPVAVAVL